MNLEINGNVISTDLIGGFKVNEHEYAVCSYVDSDGNSKIVITEIVKDGDKVKAKDIPKEDMEFVLARYKEFEAKLLEGDMNE